MMKVLSLARPALALTVFLVTVHRARFDAPPHMEVQTAVNAASFGLLAGLLLASGLTRGPHTARYRLGWLAFSALAFASFLLAQPSYGQLRMRRTFDYPGVEQTGAETTLEYVSGTRPLPKTQALLSEGQSITEIVEKAGGPGYRDMVWEVESIYEAQQALRLRYVWLLLSLGTVGFSLCEFLFRPLRRKRAGPTSIEGAAPEFDVALSYASENRDVARSLADALRAKGVRVFYDQDDQATLWGKDLTGELESIYGERSRYVMLLVSTDYVRKQWPGKEWRAAMERALQRKGTEYVLPIQLDDSVVPGLPSDVVSLSIEVGVETIAGMFVEKMTLPPRS